MELFHAHHQWANRPDDERFSTLAEMYDVTKRYHDSAREKAVDWSALRLQAAGDDLSIVGEAGVGAKVTHYAFGQLCRKLDAPASFLRDLPATLAAQNLNHRLKTRAEGRANLLFHQNGSLVLRAATSEVYSRIWNYEVVARLMETADRNGLVPAKSTFRTFDPNEKPALYASDHDMFAFMMSQAREVTGPLGERLFRGVIVVNSEVGDGSLKIIAFLFREICGNHIIWDASEIAEIRLIHVGKVRQRWSEVQARVRHYMDGAASLEEASFVEYRRQIAGTKDDVLDAVFGKRIAGLSRRVAEKAYDAVVVEEDGDPRTKWGFAQGLTRISQDTSFADVRTDLDRAAGKVLAANF